MTWRFLLFGSILAFPQLIGILLSFRLRWAPRWVAAIAAALVPGAVFFWLAPFFLFDGIREAQERGERVCGLPVMAGVFFLLAGTTVHVVVGLITHAVLSRRRRPS
jgi:hypothetical protein